MRDYKKYAQDLRRIAQFQNCFECYEGERTEGSCSSRCTLSIAADAFEELQDQIADVSKMICGLIAYAQKNADESREAEQRHYGSDSTVNVYTWMHNVKCVHERYVAMLDDIAAKLPEPPKGVE